MVNKNTLHFGVDQFISRTQHSASFRDRQIFSRNTIYVKIDFSSKPRRHTPLLRAQQNTIKQAVVDHHQHERRDEGTIGDNSTSKCFTGARYASPHCVHLLFCCSFLFGVFKLAVVCVMSVFVTMTVLTCFHNICMVL